MLLMITKNCNPLKPEWIEKFVQPDLKRTCLVLGRQKYINFSVETKAPEPVGPMLLPYLQDLDPWVCTGLLSISISTGCTGGTVPLRGLGLPDTVF